MGVVTYSMDVCTSISPARMFKAFVLDDNLIPSVIPQAIKSVETVEGDGGAGTIKLVHFGDGEHIIFPFVLSNLCYVPAVLVMLLLYNNNPACLVKSDQA